MAAGKRGAEVDTRFETDVDSALGRDPNRLRGIAILALTRPSPLTHHEATAPPARKLALRLGLALALIGGLAPAAAARAATIVPNTTFDETAAGGTCSLREAVQSSNTNTDVGGCTHTGTYGSDTILLAGGDYDLTLKGAPEDSNANGDLDVAASLTIVGLGADQTGIDGSGAITGDRVLDVLGFEASLSLFGVAIHGGAQFNIADALAPLGTEPAEQRTEEMVAARPLVAEVRRRAAGALALDEHPDDARAVARDVLAAVHAEHAAVAEVAQIESLGHGSPGRTRATCRTQPR